MEGIAYGIRHSLEVFEEEGGYMSKTISVSGGGSNSSLWNQIKCDVLGRNVETLSVSETGCLGAAILGAIGIKLYSSIEEATGLMVQPKEKLEPRKDMHQKYSKLFRLYLRAYESLGKTFAELASI
jgi:xylulokinase